MIRAKDGWTDLLSPGPGVSAALGTAHNQQELSDCLDHEQLIMVILRTRPIMLQILATQNLDSKKNHFQKPHFLRLGSEQYPRIKVFWA